MTGSLAAGDRIVIAGGTGYLGVNLARHLADFDCEVVLISRNRPTKDGPWIHATWDARTLGDWSVHLDGATAIVNLVGRTVLGRYGGALTRLTALARWGLGGTVGHGRQGISWIHERDMNRLFLRAITDDSMQGAYLATAPQPVSNADFMRELRRALGMPIGLPAKPWMVRLGAPLLMRTDPELALYGRYCVSRRLLEENFEFEFPDVRCALRDLCGA